MPNDTTTAVAPIDESPKTFPGMLVAYKAQIAAALPKHVTPDRMARIALTAFRQNTTLQKCEPASIFASVVILAQQGLEPGLNGRAYLVPYFNKKKNQYECQAIPGWKGLVELANRTGRSSVWTGAVFAGDQFDYALGDRPFVTHKPGSEDDPAKLLFVYAIGRIRGNEYPVIEVWSNEKVRRHFNRYNKVGDAHYAHGNWEMYARKVPLLQVLKYMPSSPELEAAIAMSYAADKGSQELNIKDAIEGTFSPPRDDDDAGAGDASTSGNESVKERMRASGNGTAKEGAKAEAPVYAEIAGKINGAKSGDDVDAAVSLINDGLPEAQRVELLDLAKARRLELK